MPLRVAKHENDEADEREDDDDHRPRSEDRAAHAGDARASRMVLVVLNLTNTN
jgi:hypothetical protein